MALQLTGEEFEMIRDNFLEIDKDGDGRIAREEMLAFLEGETEEHVDFMMKVMGVDGNGTLEFHEFLEIMAFLLYNKGLNQNTARKMFRALDKDGDGFLSAEELKRFYEMVTDADENVPSASEIEGLMRCLDINGDGKIDVDEFINAVEYLFK